jgi:hypothetical protein
MQCFGGLRLLSFATVICALLPKTSHATDEIYNAGVAAAGQFYIQQHLDYVGDGLKSPAFDGGMASHRSLNGRTEFAYGVTDGWELALYLPFSTKRRPTKFFLWHKHSAEQFDAEIFADSVWPGDPTHHRYP